MQQMTRPLALAGFALGLALGGLWLIGAFAPLADWAGAQQKAVQTALAGAVRALRAGEAGAWTALIVVCFSYGFFHAVGPGHGKAVIGSYGMARRVRLGPLVGLAVASSVAQAAVAVGLVAMGALILGLKREAMEDVAEQAMTPASHALIALLGLWLLWRGARGLMRAKVVDPEPMTGDREPQRTADQARDHGHSHGHHHHHHHHDDACGCGHAHGPSAEQVAEVASLRDAVLLVGAIALRPCSGALFLLVLTFAMGIGWAGVAGTFAMGLGTASVTVLVAVLAFWAREGALASLPGAGLARYVPGVELVLGAGLAAVSLVLLIRSL